MSSLSPCLPSFRTQIHLALVLLGLLLAVMSLYWQRSGLLPQSFSVIREHMTYMWHYGTHLAMSWRYRPQTAMYWRGGSSMQWRS